MQKLVQSVLFWRRATPQGARAASSTGRQFAAFMVAVIAISSFGGYQFSLITSRLDDFSLQRADQLMEIEESLDDAAIDLGQQIQEWKDMLLRVDNPDQYARHRQGFIDSSVAVQQALLRAKGAMLTAGMDTQEIERLAAEHKALLTKYMLAHGKLKPQRGDSSRAADQEVIGMDRELQRHLAAVKDAVELRARQHMSGAMPEAARQYRLVGALGAASLIFMAFLGFAVATRLHGHRTGAEAQPCS